MLYGWTDDTTDGWIFHFFIFVHGKVEGEGQLPFIAKWEKDKMMTPCYFSPLSEIPDSIEGVQWRKIIE